MKTHVIRLYDRKRVYGVVTNIVSEAYCSSLYASSDPLRLELLPIGMNKWRREGRDQEMGLVQLLLRDSGRPLRGSKAVYV